MKNNNINEKIHINKTAAIVILITFVLFITALAGMFTCIVIDIVNNDGGYVSLDNGGGGSKKPVGTTAQDAPAAVVSKAGNKTGILLPCATKSGTYLAPSTASTSEITNISSAAGALINVTSGNAVAMKNADVKIFPASMTKVMTLLVACENAKDPNALVTVTEEMVKKYQGSYKPSEEGPSIAFTWKQGYQVTVEDLLYLVIYESDTYACWLLSEYVAGSEAAFVDMMNKRAGELGLTSTQFKNSTGLFDEGHYTTCREMAAIMAAAINNETAKTVLGSKALYRVDIYVGGEKVNTVGMYSNWYTGRLEKYQYENTNPKYAGNGSDIEIIGGKTGYETVPMNCYVTAGINDVTGTMYVCVQVGRISDDQPEISAKTSTDDNRLIYQKYAKD